MEKIRNLMYGMHPSLKALLETAIMFLPAIPAYLWMWPKLSSTSLQIIQSLVYIYILGGTLFIGLRGWNWSQLGLNKNGIGLSLCCGLVLLVGRLLIIFSITWAIRPDQLTLLRFLGELIYYFGLVGLVEELLFRGLIYRLLEDWRGARWAIWGSSIGFMLWHVFGQGPLMGIASLLIGLIFALIRWRAGGILGLILVHGLYDLETALLVSEDNALVVSKGALEIHTLGLVYIGLALLVFVPIFLWKIYPYFIKITQVDTRN
jgi:membrane protease YdiL (CAAX protease family)